MAREGGTHLPGPQSSVVEPVEVDVRGRAVVLERLAVGDLEDIAPVHADAVAEGAQVEDALAPEAIEQAGIDGTRDGADIRHRRPPASRCGDLAVEEVCVRGQRDVKELSQCCSMVNAGGVSVEVITLPASALRLLARSR